MSSTFGKVFCVHTWGESHGKSIGAIIDGCPSGLPLSEADIQPYLNRRKPGQNIYTSSRSEADICKIHSGIFNGFTTGTPIMVIIENLDQNPDEYDELADVYRPGHADYTYDMKYGFRDHRGGGRSSGRETAARVIGGAVALKLLRSLGIEINAFTQSIGPVHVNNFNLEVCPLNPLYMPDMQAAYIAGDFIDELIANKDSAGGIVSCLIRGLPPDIGEPTADKFDAELAKALISIGAVKGVEFGAGFASARMSGIKNNDEFYIKHESLAASAASKNEAYSGKKTADSTDSFENEENKASTDAENQNTDNTHKSATADVEKTLNIAKKTNNSGGVLGGISDGSAVIINVAIKPTPSIAATQKTVDRNGSEVLIEIGGRHDPVIVPRAVVVIECMCAITVLDLMLRGMSSRLDNIIKIYSKNRY